eukprot:5547586-Amphidinium_carterae.1
MATPGHLIQHVCSTGVPLLHAAPPIYLRRATHPYFDSDAVQSMVGGGFAPPSAPLTLTPSRVYVGARVLRTKI